MISFPKTILSLALCLVLFVGCKQSMVISDVNYSQPIEMVLTPDQDGVVQDMRHGLSFNILPIQYAETQDSSSVTTKQVRMIRGKEGYYYITAPGYTSVYVMSPEKSSLKLEQKLTINTQGIAAPAFNQRESHVQLLDRETNSAYMLTAEGVQENESENIAQGGQ